MNSYIRSGAVLPDSIREGHHEYFAMSNHLGALAIPMAHLPLRSEIKKLKDRERKRIERFRNVSK